MIPLAEHDTIGDALRRARDAYGNLPLIAVPANPQRDYLPDGYELSYEAAAKAVDALAKRYRAAGYGLGHRVGLFLDNRPEHFLHKLALNSIGACCVPVNPDYRATELAYLIDHAKVDLVVALPSRHAALEAALALTREQPAVSIEAVDISLPPPRRQGIDGAVEANTPASILYTSGTTGRPKGCVLSHRYELAAGAWYANRGHLADVRQGCERLYNPLPLFHVNAAVLSFFCMLLTGGCQVQAERFHPTRWWNEIRESRATIVHYLGVIVSMLLQQPENPGDKEHQVRFGFGAGVEPQLHARFEQRFGFPLVEIWGMTEIVRPLVDNVSPRQVGTRAFGRAVPGLDVRIADDAGEEVSSGAAGEMLVRHSEAEPRKDFFSGYLDDSEATEAAWRGGWFHTGDIVTRDDSGMLHFMDRRKNIIRRSGENIAAAEVEALLLTHPWVENVAVLAVPDDVREEEVLACIVLKPSAPDATQSLGRTEAARAIFEFCREHQAYYKAPGWLLFRTEIPTTGTQKIQKHRLFTPGTDPRSDPEIVDLRTFKRRT